MMEGFQENTRKLLIMMLAECCREFEKLPIIKYGDILEIYCIPVSGCRFEEVSRKRRERQEKKDD